MFHHPFSQGEKSHLPSLYLLQIIKSISISCLVLANPPVTFVSRAMAVLPAYSENCATRWSLLASRENHRIWLGGNHRLRLHTSGLCWLGLGRDMKNRRRCVLSRRGFGSRSSRNCCGFAVLCGWCLEFIHSCERWISKCLKHDLSKNKGYFTWWKQTSLTWPVLK